MGNRSMAVKSLADQNTNTSHRYHRTHRVAYSSSRSLHNQKVLQRKRMRKNPDYSTLPHHNFTLFNEIFKLKKSSLIIALLVFTIVLSAVPLSVAFKSYVWERHRALIGEGNLLYDLFVIEEFMGGSEGGDPEAIMGGYTVPTLMMKTYVVKKGDSLFSIARRFNISIDAILYLEVGEIEKAVYSVTNYRQATTALARSFKGNIFVLWAKTSALLQQHGSVRQRRKHAAAASAPPLWWQNRTRPPRPSCTLQFPQSLHRYRRAQRSTRCRRCGVRGVQSRRLVCR